MRKQTQFNGLWQNMATGVIRYADTDHGVLWERTLEGRREVWRQLPVSKSHLRGYLQASSENGWQMVSSNRDAAREPDAYEAWYGDMFPHGVPLRVSEYACDVVHAAMLACESDAANGWVVDTRGAVHELMPEEREMIRLTMAMDAMDDSWETDVTGPEPAMESVETVVVEPVEVEHDGVVDVELAETSETIPVVEAETADAEPDGYGQYVGMWTRGNERVCVCADGTVWAHFDHPDDAYESWVRQDTLYGVDAFVCETFADRGWAHVSCEADDDVPRYVTDRDAAVPGTVCADDAANGWRYDGLSAVIRDYADVPMPRAVESEPVLPAECNAVTQEIPEVPPQVNDQARVLKVSEHVIPTGQKVAGGEMFPDVSYRSVHAFTVPVLDAAGNVVKRKKVAYAFRHKGMVHVVRRDRYERAGRDATVEAEIAAFVAKLRKAA